MKFELEKFLKNNRFAVIELKDEVEYLVDDAAEEALRRGDRQITLIRLFDREKRTFNADEVKAAMMNGGIVDYLEKR